MIRIICSFMVILLVLSGCSSQSRSESESKSTIDNNAAPKETIPQEPNKQETVKPDTVKFILPATMPEDFNFKISYGYGEVQKNVIDTYTGQVTKDLIAKGTATADFSFTSEELSSIYDKMKGINFAQEKQSTADIVCERTPSNADTWQVTANSETATLSWTDKTCTLTKNEEQLLELRQYIQHIVALKDSYQALPEAEGGYD
ncbi:hypothetical protein PCCS19_03770 [Paenibacillus sp. CCS19]|uniref:hypothetical protein n=1 Tax=Paenibacillus sp. CCS19 TaxID=3158387 RepID=UPI002566C323|nr:hypothetical protein [Paenibacillus cellulosilyticus]GMK37324.1 hypothetical protein PCCS19_03770 [Paenibacillus cellulosilyticus]